MHRRVRLCIAALTMAPLVMAGSAAASNSTSPQLASPGPGARVPVGNVALVVFDPGLSGKLATPVFVVLSNRRTLSRGVLAPPPHCQLKCDFEEMHPWAHHPGDWLFRTTFHRHGFWGVTPGTYYWQAYHFVPDCRPSCIEYSPIQRFQVVR